MDKNFIENCKLLQRHFTKLTQADTTAQSNHKKFAVENASQIISDAKKLLLAEQIEELSNEDIALLKEQSVNKYANELQKLESKKSFRSCKKEQIKWDDEIFLSPLPHPKYNAEYLKFKKVDKDTEIENERKEIEELSNIILNKYGGSETGENSNSKKIKTGTQIENEKQISFIIEDKDYNDTINENKTVQIPAKITDIPELKVTPQKNKKVEFLEVKKINIEDKDSTADFDAKEDKSVDMNKEMMSNTIIKWKKYTKLNKTAKINNPHIKKIDNFLENLQKYRLANANKSKSDLTNKNSPNSEVIATKIKPKSSNCIETKVSSYEYRFKAQKDIIEMQKQKLEEQNKLIEQLKLNKIEKEAKESLENAKELKKTILYTSKYKYKAKPEVKQETNESENNELNLALSFNKAPKIVKMMEDRARERHERRLLILERKRLLEEEKKKQAEDLVQRKLKEETEEKQKRLDRMKKQREHVRQLELKKQLEKKRYIQLNENAAQHYKTKLKNSGLKRFKMLIYEVKIKTEIAKRFYETNIIIVCFKSWRNYSSAIIDNKNKLATNLFNKNLLENMMSCWKSYHFEAIQSKQVAIDRYEMSLQHKCFIGWHKLVCEYRVQYSINAQKAERYFRRTLYSAKTAAKTLLLKHPKTELVVAANVVKKVDMSQLRWFGYLERMSNERMLLFHCFENWRSLPAIMQIERVQNERKRKWRLRVAEILSDYDPLKNYEFDLVN